MTNPKNATLDEAARLAREAATVLASGQTASAGWRLADALGLAAEEAKRRHAEPAEGYNLPTGRGHMLTPTVREEMPDLPKDMGIEVALAYISAVARTQVPGLLPEEKLKLIGEHSRKLTLEAIRRSERLRALELLAHDAHKFLSERVVGGGVCAVCRCPTKDCTCGAVTVLAELAVTLELEAPDCDHRWAGGRDGTACARCDLRCPGLSPWGAAQKHGGKVAGE